MTEALDIRRAVLEDADACAAIMNEWIDETAWMPRVRPPEAVERHYRDNVHARYVWEAA